MPAPTILVHMPGFPPMFGDAVRAAAPDLAVVDRVAHCDPSTVDAVLSWRLDDATVSQLPNLALAGSIGAGVEKLFTPALPASVTICRIIDPQVQQAVAQYCVLMALRHTRLLQRYDVQQPLRDWTRHPVAASTHRVGLMGVGEVGVEIARQMGALGFRVTGWSTRPRPDLPFPTLHGEAGLDALLADSEILVCILPSTPATRGMLNARTLGRLPRGAYLINVARGDLLDEACLPALLADGTLSGAALDVQANEPLPPDDPLWALPGVTITPHIAGQAMPDIVAEQFVASVRAMRAGEPIPRTVDRSREY